MTGRPATLASQAVLCRAVWARPSPSRLTLARSHGRSALWLVAGGCWRVDPIHTCQTEASGASGTGRPPKWARPTDDEPRTAPGGPLAAPSLPPTEARPFRRAARPGRFRPVALLSVPAGPSTHALLPLTPFSLPSTTSIPLSITNGPTHFARPSSRSSTPESAQHTFCPLASIAVPAQLRLPARPLALESIQCLRPDHPPARSPPAAHCQPIRSVRSRRL